MIADNDPRIKTVLADPSLKKALYEGKLTKPLDTPAPTAPAVAAAVEDPIWKRAGYDSQDALLEEIKNARATKEYNKTLEARVNELNARAGAEGGPLGQKLKTVSEELSTVRAQLEEVKRTPPPVQTDLNVREVLELYKPDFTDEIKPENFADPEAAKIVKKQQHEFKKFVDDLSSKINRLSPANSQKQIAEVLQRNEELQAQINLLAKKDEMREVKFHTEESERTFGSIYDEADAFVKRLGYRTTRPFKEIDSAIANSGPDGSESRTLFLKTLPETDRKAWETAIPIINGYGRGVEVPVNGGRATVVRFEKFDNVKQRGYTLDDLYNLELLKSGQLEEKRRTEILEALRTGAQSVIASAVIPPGVKGIPDTAIQGERLPIETSLDEKTKRLKELIALGPKLMQDKKAFDEYKALSADVKGTVRQQMAQGVFKRKR
jgi:hypothetical protein